jgi:hypothetical protein
MKVAIINDTIALKRNDVGHVSNRQGIVHHEFTPEGAMVNKETYNKMPAHLQQTVHLKQHGLQMAKKTGC